MPSQHVDVLIVGAGLSGIGAGYRLQTARMFAALFVLGWIFQFVGHSVYEHRNPAFFRNFTHLLVGPLWILNDLIPVVKPRTA